MALATNYVIASSIISRIATLVSYERAGGVGCGYQLPRECWKDENGALLIWVSSGNGNHHPIIVDRVWEDGGSHYRDNLLSK